VPENKKVRDFMAGITDTQCANIKLNILADPLYMNNFAMMIIYCATAINMIKRNDSSSRQISKVQMQNNRGGRGGRNQRGRRGGHGRGGRGYQGNNCDPNYRNSNVDRGNHGRGGRGGRGHQNDPNDQPIARGYSRDDWANLSQADRNRVYRERDRMETARTVASFLQQNQAANNNDDLSTMVPSVINLPQSNREQQQTRNSSQVSQVSLTSTGQNMNQRQSGIGAYSTCHRKEARIAMTKLEGAVKLLSCRAELDSHADTCSVNTVAFIMEYLGKVAEVHGFSKLMEAMKDISIVKAALAYDNSTTGETVILAINQALFSGKDLTHILLNQNQMHAHGLVVNNCPKHLSKGKSTHSIKVQGQDYSISLKLHGIMSYFDVQTPTKDELHNCPHIELTSTNEEWELYSMQFAEEESKIEGAEVHHRNIKSLNVTYDDFHDRIIRILATTKVSKTQLFVDSEDLAKRWLVGPKIAQDTVKATTQSFICNAIHPIERRFKTKAATLRYNQLKCHFYSDMFFSQEKSILGNTCGQLFVIPFGFTKFGPMKSKGEAHLALQELFHDVGIPQHIHTDGAKEMVLGNWKKTCNEYGIKMSQTEKASPWQNKAKIEIRELKKHTRRLMGK
jgi:hypothetical protein